MTLRVEWVGGGEGQGGPLIERSLGWVRAKLQELGIPET
jgi:hypothetical protein